MRTLFDQSCGLSSINCQVERHGQQKEEGAFAVKMKKGVHFAAAHDLTSALFEPEIARHIPLTFNLIYNFTFSFVQIRNSCGRKV